MLLPILTVGANLLAAAGLGAAIGLERQWRQRLAGLRTNTLVALGAATFLIYARLLSDDAGAERIAAQVVSGIGFLGAGVIFKEGLNVRGLNTAATLWCAAAVGLLAGGGFPIYGALAAAGVIATNLLMRPLVRLINRQPVDSSEMATSYLVSILCHGGDAARLRSRLAQEFAQVPDVEVSELSSGYLEGADRVEISATVTSHKRREIALETIVGSLSQEIGVTRASWTSATPSV